jgi:hypothetical protein
MVDGKATELPSRIDEVFAIRDRDSLSLGFYVGDSTSSARGDRVRLPAGAVAGPEHLGALLGFVRELGDVTGKTGSRRWSPRRTHTQLLTVFGSFADLRN